MEEWGMDRSSHRKLMAPREVVRSTLLGSSHPKDTPNLFRQRTRLSCIHAL